MKHSLLTSKTTGTVLGLVFFLTGSAIAQQIPFEYYYGRIVGRQQLSLDYHNFEESRAYIDGSFYFGFRNHFRFGVDRLFTWIPELSEDALRWNEPPLRGDIQLKDGLRLHNDLILWDEDHDMQSGESHFGYWNRESANIDQSLIYLQRAGIEYREEHSLYQYLEGPWLNPSQSLIEGDWNLSYSDQDSRQQGKTNEYINYWGDDSNTYKTIDLQTAITRGFGERSNVYLLAGLLRASTNSDHRYIRDAAAPVDTSLRVSDGISDGDNTQLTFNLASTYKPNSKTWIAVSADQMLRSIGSDWHSSSVRDSVVLYEENRRSDDDYFQSNWSISLNWVSRSVTIPYQQLLDNFQGYYGMQLPANTLRFSGAAQFRYQDQSSELRIYPADDIATQNSFKGVYRELNLDLGLEYFIMPNLNCSVMLTSRRTVSNSSRSLLNSHGQRTSTTFGVQYRNFSWDQTKRQEIGWSEISDIDYLLGAMPRPGDWRVSLSVRPPTYYADFRANEVSLFNFFKGEDDSRWEERFIGEVGVWSFLTLTAGAYVTQHPYRGGTETSISQSRSIVIQPTSFARIELYWGQIAYHYSDAVFEDFPEFDPDTSTWSYNWKLDIII